MTQMQTRRVANLLALGWLSLVPRGATLRPGTPVRLIDPDEREWLIQPDGSVIPVRPEKETDSVGP